MFTCEIKSHIEGIKSRFAQTVIVGWAFSARRRALQVRVTCKGQAVQGLQVRWTERPDILSAFFALPDSVADASGPDVSDGVSGLAEGSDLFGFRISFPSSLSEEYQLQFFVEEEESARQSYRIRGETGVPAGVAGIKEKLKKGIKDLTCRNETGAEKPGAEQIEIGEDDPLISIIVPVYCPEPLHFMEMIRSVTEQTYERWQLCLADGSDGSLAVDGYYEALAREAAGADSRVHYRKLEKNMGISGNTNEALVMAEGRWIGMVDHDDILEPDALWEAVKALRREPKAGFLYTDSDLADEDGIKYYNPLLKPGWSPETMYSANYITHFSMIRKDLLEEAGGFDREMDGAQDWDVFFRVSERAEKIVHVPKILYHWRVARSSTARTVETKPYALDAQLRAINAHFRRTGLDGQAFFQDRANYLIRVAWNQPTKWKIMEFKEGRGIRELFDPPERSESEAYIIVFDRAKPEPVSEELCRELSGWAVQDGIGLVFPKLLSKDGRIYSAGVTEERGQAVVLYRDSENHTADLRGNTDWYRNVLVQVPALFAVSRKNWERYGGIRPGDGLEALAEYGARLSAAGLRHLMNPFAQAVCGGEISADSGERIGELYLKFWRQRTEETVRACRQ